MLGDGVCNARGIVVACSRRWTTEELGNHLPKRFLERSVQAGDFEKLAVSSLAAFFLTKSSAAEFKAKLTARQVFMAVQLCKALR